MSRRGATLGLCALLGIPVLVTFELPETQECGAKDIPDIALEEPVRRS